MNTSMSSVLVAGIAISVLVGCDNKQSSDAATSQTVTNGIPPSAPADANAQHSSLLAAAEPFETLTEQAGTANSAVLSQLVADVRRAANAVSRSLDQGQRATLKSQLDEIAANEKAGDRTGVALAAVEGYRTLVESAPDNAPTPRAVSLLDYAGFRFQANLSAKPLRWDDAAAAVDFADQHWATLAPKISDTSLRSEMSRSVADMRKAVEAKNEPLAKSASTTELDLVDKLEAYFTAQK